MKVRQLTFAILPLVLSACGDGGDPTVVQQPGGITAPPAEETRLQKEAREWTKETKELGAAAWDATKEKTAEYAEKSEEYYETAKEKSSEYYKQAKEKSAEYYEQAKEKSVEYYEQAKKDAQADMEQREGHPPPAQPSR